MTVEDEIEEITAYHEAGHAVMAAVLGGRIIRVSIEPPEDDGLKRFGESIVSWPVSSDAAIYEAELKVSLAGPVAELLYRSEDAAIESIPEFAADWQRVIESALRLKTTKREQLDLISRAESWVRAFLNQTRHWAAVSAVADELLAHHTLEHEQLQESISFWVESVAD
jgi:hypothetical protein